MFIAYEVPGEAIDALDDGKLCEAAARAAANVAAEGKVCPEGAVDEPVAATAAAI